MFLDEAKIETLRALIEQSDTVAIVSHVNPDGDALGSSLGMCAALLKQGKNACVLLPTVHPDYYDFLPNSDRILVGEKDIDRCAQAIAAADLIIMVDLNQLKRTGLLAEKISESQAPKVLIDHHPNPETERLSVVFSDVEISSASELAYWVTCQMYGSGYVDKDMATCFYTGICTDTGSFSYSCNHKSVYTAAGNLAETGIDIHDIHDAIYNVFSENRVRFLGYCLTELLHVHSDILMAYIAVSWADQKRFGLVDGDMESIVNYTLSMKDIDVGVMIKESPKEVRMSFRSKRNFDVNTFAAKYFRGGGHRKASGATSPYDFATTEAKLVEHLYNELKPAAR
ncbi:MAG: bifunctional oligoribonuclease/PAP phosphatase NrnA [Bacteroidales bacterium]|nr:bifunctional oligoribonuclease/PAP phosphatase NrnA [Bacteroidales bacterium]